MEKSGFALTAHNHCLIWPARVEKRHGEDLIRPKHLLVAPTDALYAVQTVHNAGSRPVLWGSKMAGGCFGLLIDWLLEGARVEQLKLSRAAREKGHSLGQGARQ